MCTCIRPPARSSSFRSPFAASTRASFDSKLASYSTSPIYAGSRAFLLCIKKKEKKKSTDEIRTHVVLRTHRIRQVSVRDLEFRLQTHRPVFGDVLAVAEANLSADHHIRADIVVLWVGESVRMDTGPVYANSPTTRSSAGFREVWMRQRDHEYLHL